MKIYWKAVRPDGTDFHTGTVDYAGALATGKPVARKPLRTVFACCTDGVYHASDAAAETLIGGSWPCRLFQVSGRPVVQQGHKRGFRSLRVLREVPAHLALGPNGEQVAALIAQASRISPEQAAQLNAARGAAREAAWGAPGIGAEYAAWEAARDAARGAARDAVWDAARVTAGVASRAATGLLVRDLVSSEVFDTLYGPWASVMSPEAT
jgi:hypothetical protein